MRSFADSDGDGVGDLRGVASRLDHLEWLGVDGIWLSPVTVSPDDDWGYDVADYRDVQPVLGGLEAFDELVAAAGARGIRVLVDLVPNHTSVRHPWFAESRSSRDASRRDWYVWADPKPDGSPPNNWVSTFGGSAWELDGRTGQCFLHNFLPSMPDLDWWSEEVREEFDAILRFWLDRGVAGFRIDVANAIVKDRLLRDNPPPRPDDPDPEAPERGQSFVYNANRPEVHDVFRRWRAVADAYEPPGLLLGETWVLELERLASFYGNGRDELDLGFNFPFAFAPFEAGALRAVVEGTEAALPVEAWPVWFGSSHDVERFPSRWCGGDERKVRCALLVLLALRGTAVLYYGDEIGMEEVPVPEEALRDPVGRRKGPRHGRDGRRTPMQWSAEEGAGFTGAGDRPWLPLGPYRERNVAAQRDDPRSVLRLVRDLVALRRADDDLRLGAYESLPVPAGVWAWRRGGRAVVAVNLSDDAAAIEGVEGAVAISTGRDRDGEAVRGRLELGPWEGVVAT